MRYNLLISELERCWSALRAETASCSIQCHIKEQDYLINSLVGCVMV